MHAQVDYVHVILVTNIVYYNFLCIFLCLAFRNILHTKQPDFWSSNQFLMVITTDFLLVVA